MPQPLFFNQIKYVPSVETAMHRGLWSFVFLFFFLFFFSNTKEFRLLFYSYKKIIILSVTAMLITVNWTGFIYSVSIKQVQDASLGYFLTPMISICLGYIFLKESVNINKIFSFLLMFFACLILFIKLENFPYIAILIGTTWAVYGLLRKQIKVSPATGLLYESAIITCVALPYLMYLSFYGSSYFKIELSFTSFMLISTGLVTIFPLFFFNLGLKYISLGLAGVLFYIAPSFHFITSIYILDEHMSFDKLIAFVMIWLGVCVFLYDVLKKI